MNKLFLLIFIWGVASADDTLIEKANQLYQSKSFDEAANVYEEIVSKDEENYAAWLRLSQAYIQLKNGEKAVDSLIRVSEGQQLPRSFLHYLRAQAYFLREDQDTMWQELKLAASTGFSQLNQLDSEFWDKVREDKTFIEVRAMVEKKAHPCLFDEKHREFDFWLGDWKVYSDIERKSPIAGTNQIAREQSGCMLSENWVSAAGNPGYSMNYYDGTLNKWVQHWVSSGGFVINLEGGLVNDSMVLQGKIFYKNGQTPAVRELKGTWTPKENGVVRQFFEESVDGGESWYPWFEGFYFPVTEEPEQESEEG